MVFSSIIFLFAFLPLVLAINFALPVRFRNFFLLLASLLFYAWGEPVYTLVMLASITINYVFGLWVGATEAPRPRFVILSIGVALNLGLLLYFKYANFLVENVNSVLAWLGHPAIEMDPVALPLGISFFTFQAMSYVIDVYRRHVALQKNPVDLALYVSLFPQLIAGPIVRYADVAKEIVQRRVSLDDFADGIRIFIIGLGKKVLIANVLAEQVDLIFALPNHELTTPLAWMGSVFFMLQLYFDFGGYSDMAIGLGRMMGFHFLPNFNYPYISKSLTELWQRWHISLSTWFRDYLFNPLGGYRCSRPRAYMNLMIVFILCGLWHGASWNFFFFGLYQALFLVFERLIRAKQKPFFKSPLGHGYLLFILLTTMVFFRGNDMAQTLTFFRCMAGFDGNLPAIHHPAAFVDPQVVLSLVAGLIGCAPFVPWLRKRLPPAATTIGGALAILAIFLLCCAKLAAGTHNPFIYFRF